MNIELLVTILTSVTTIIVTLIVFRKEIKIKRIELENDALKRQNDLNKIELSCLKVLFESSFYALISERIGELFRTTKTERFLILFAINGKDSFKHVTVCYEAHRDGKYGGAISRYVRVSIDDHYEYLLKQIEHTKYAVLNIDELPQDSLLYNIYTSDVENIKHSVVKFIGRKNVDEYNDVLFYCSIATRDEHPFDLKELTQIGLSIDGLRAHIDEIKISIN